ncbi:MAG: hypothetical protein GX633_05390 [Clostridiales bacterium]|jgi:protein arginine kinase activator|nr:hypothetical protein [Clostridiales bacterium]
MLCEKCGKNEVTVYVKSVINGAVTEKRLCSKCAAEENAVFPSDIFSDMFSLKMPKADTGAETLRCPLCGSAGREIIKSGKAGCSECYSIFNKIMTSMTHRIHGSAKHTGSLPGSCGEEIKREKKIEELKSKLKAAIDTEAYEDAAVLRDEIRSLERGESI